MSRSSDLKDPQIIEDALKMYGSVRIRVTGGSMIPIIPPRAFVTLKRVPQGEINNGDIVAVLKKRLVLHRIVAVDESSVLLIGDAIGRPARFSRKHVIAKVTRVEFYGLSWPLEGPIFHLFSIFSLSSGPLLLRLLRLFLEIRKVPPLPMNFLDLF